MFSLLLKTIRGWWEPWQAGERSPTGGHGYHHSGRTDRCQAGVWPLCRQAFQFIRRNEAFASVINAPYFDTIFSKLFENTIQTKWNMECSLRTGVCSRTFNQYMGKEIGKKKKYDMCCISNNCFKIKQFYWAIHFLKSWLILFNLQGGKTNWR